MTYTRRDFVKTVGAASIGLAAAPHIIIGQTTPEATMVPFGNLDFNVTRFGLGGQGSIQWTPEGESPVDIILKAHRLGVNYFDTSNIYDQSQLHFGEALRRLNLNPAQASYNEKARRSIFVVSKSRLRFCKGGVGKYRGGTQGSGRHVLDDLRRSLSQIYGDGKGNYPKGAYLDVMQVHSLWNMGEIDAIYHNIDNPEADNVGCLAALLDVRDGTNRTGLNPSNEKLIRHIGLTGHYSSPVLMEAILRDDRGIFDTLLVAINANDRRRLNHQYNVIPIAAAKGMGVIGMKVFAAGAMYDVPAHWTQGPHEIVRRVGGSTISSNDLITYTLSTPGVNTAIMGIGHIDDDPSQCQIVNNVRDASEVAKLSTSERRAIEQRAGEVKNGNTNFFQAAKESMTGPQNIRIEPIQSDGRRYRLTWDTAIAADEPIREYRIIRDNVRIATVEHQPQTTYAKPFTYGLAVDDAESHTVTIAAVDADDRAAISDEVIIPAAG